MVPKSPWKSLNVGDFPSKWTQQYSGDTIEVVNSPVAGGTKALKFKGAVGWAANIYRNNEMPQDNVTVEADVWTVSAMSGDRDTVTIWYNGACVAFCTQGPSLTAYFGDSTYNGSFQSESWHHVKMEIDWNSSRYKAYIDNTLYYDGTFTKRNSPANKRNLWLHASNSAESTRIGYWDNIVLKDNNNITVPQSPTVNVTTSGTTVTFSWDAVPNADGYLLCVDVSQTGQAFDGDLEYEFDLGNITTVSFDLWEGACFYVALKAYNSAGSSDYSNIEQFQIQGGGFKPIHAYHATGGTNDQNHDVLLFFDPQEKSLIMEIRANYLANWDDILEDGGLSVWIPNGLNVDWGNTGVYVTRSITSDQIENLPYPMDSSFFEKFNSSFYKQDIGNIKFSENASLLIDGGLNFSLTAVAALGAGGGVAAGAATWQIATDWLNEYFSDPNVNSGWSGDSSSLYPQFISIEKDSNGNMYGNTGKVINFNWIPTDFFLGFVDVGYNAIAIKVSFLNWDTQTNPIYLFSQFKVHDAFNKPWITLFSRKITYYQK